MKTLKVSILTKALIALVLCGIFVFGNSQVFGQKWNQAQKEVWTAVVTLWEHIKQGDLEAISALDRAEGSLDWWSERSVPFEKNDMMLQYKGWLNYSKPVSYKLEPLNIHIIGDVANVFYLYTWKGSLREKSGRQMATFIKQDKRWKFMGRMTCSCDKLPYCK